MTDTPPPDAPDLGPRDELAVPLPEGWLVVSAVDTGRGHSLGVVTLHPHGDADPIQLAHYRPQAMTGEAAARLALEALAAWR